MLKFVLAVAVAVSLGCDLANPTGSDAHKNVYASKNGSEVLVTGLVGDPARYRVYYASVTYYSDKVVDGRKIANETIMLPYQRGVNVCHVAIDGNYKPVKIAGATELIDVPQ